MQTNDYTQAMFFAIMNGNQLFDQHGNAVHGVGYIAGSYGIASLFMRSENAPAMQLNHVLALNNNEDMAFQSMVNILTALNQNRRPIISQY